MNAHAETSVAERMSAESFLAWLDTQPSGRFELVDGEVVEMAAERWGHGKVKFATALALRQAVRSVGLGCEVATDGMAVQVADDRIFEPDALVRCGPALDDEAVLVPDPVVIVEVLSPSTRHVDAGKKLLGYLAMPSVRHYLILDADERKIIHHRRENDDPLGLIETRIVSGSPESGADLRLDPPGLVLRARDLFEAP